MKVWTAMMMAGGLTLMAPPAEAQTANELAAGLSMINLTPLISLQNHYVFLAAVERCSGFGWAFSDEEVEWLRSRFADQFAAVAEAQRQMIWGLVQGDPAGRLVMDEASCAAHRQAAEAVFPGRFAVVAQTPPPA